jgi:MarC family membrane protein
MEGEMRAALLFLPPVQTQIVIDFLLKITVTVATLCPVQLSNALAALGVASSLTAKGARQTAPAVTPCPMLETALTAFATFFAVISPIDTAVLLASLTPNMTRVERRAISVKAVFIATLIVLAFALFGGPVLAQLGVSLAALETAGGIILLAIALEMTLAKRPQPTTLSAKESAEAENKAEAHAEIAVFPLATPLLAGPGAMTSAIVLAAGTKGDFKLLSAVVVAILAVMGVTLMLLLAAQEIHQLIGVTARKVIVRVFGVLLAALAVQSIFNGLAATHLFR